MMNLSSLFQDFLPDTEIVSSHCLVTGCENITSQSFKGFSLTTSLLSCAGRAKHLKTLKLTAALFSTNRLDKVSKNL